MSEAGRKAITKWMLVFANPYLKDDPRYKEADDARTLLYGAVMGGAFIGLVLGFILGLIF